MSGGAGGSSAGWHPTPPGRPPSCCLARGRPRPSRTRAPAPSSSRSALRWLASSARSGPAVLVLHLLPVDGAGGRPRQGRDEGHVLGLLEARDAAPDEL